MATFQPIAMNVRHIEIYLDTAHGHFAFRALLFECLADSREPKAHSDQWAEPRALVRAEVRSSHIGEVFP